MNLRKGKKTVEDICIAENEWWLKYTKEHYKKHVTVGEMFNKDLYGKYTVEEWLLFLLTSILNAEKYIRKQAPKTKYKKGGFHYKHQ